MREQGGSGCGRWVERRQARARCTSHCAAAPTTRPSPEGLLRQPVRMAPNRSPSHLLRQDLQVVRQVLLDQVLNARLVQRLGPHLRVKMGGGRQAEGRREVVHHLRQ